MLAVGPLVQGALVSVPGSATVFTMGAETGVFLYTGNAALLTVTMPVATGAYTLTGQDALFIGTMPAVAGTYALSGQDAVLSVNFAVAAGSYALTGNAAVLIPTLGAVTGAYTLTGNAALFATTFPVSVGTYTLTGNDVILASLVVGSSHKGPALPATPLLTRKKTNLASPHIDQPLHKKKHKKNKKRPPYVHELPPPPKKPPPPLPPLEMRQSSPVGLRSEAFFALPDLQAQQGDLSLVAAEMQDVADARDAVAAMLVLIDAGII